PSAPRRPLRTTARTSPAQRRGPNHSTGSDGVSSISVNSIHLPPDATKPRPGAASDADQGPVLCTPNGIRTRAATLRGWCPRPLDDGGWSHRTDPEILSVLLGAELGGEDSNPQELDQNQLRCELHHPQTGDDPREGAGGL